MKYNNLFDHNSATIILIPHLLKNKVSPKSPRPSWNIVCGDIYATLFIANNGVYGNRYNNVQPISFEQLSHKWAVCGWSNY